MWDDDDNVYDDDDTFCNEHLGGRSPHQAKREKKFGGHERDQGK